jgi:uncharacterized protein (TIGR01777 family)
MGPGTRCGEARATPREHIMKIVIAGGTGFLGTALSTRLLGNGHEIVLLTRGSTRAAPRRNVTAAAWAPDGTSGPWARELAGADAVVNLAGESIAAKRWTVAQKEKLTHSRLSATRSLVAAMREMKTPPAVFLSGSAVGYYGDRGDETLTEASAPGSDFLSSLCQAWEAAASEAAQLTRVAFVRTGIVLDRNEGALPQMLLPFRLFAGGPVGSGRQYLSWIHRDDWARLAAWILESEGARGPVNATGPRPVTSAEFATALGRALHRPSLMRAPGFALRLALGEMADALLLSGQRALPARASDLGFSFRFASVDAALADVLQ